MYKVIISIIHVHAFHYKYIYWYMVLLHLHICWKRTEYVFSLEIWVKFFFNLPLHVYMVTEKILN